MTLPGLPELSNPWLLHWAEATIFGFAVMAVMGLLPRLSAGIRQFLAWTALARFALPLSVLGLGLASMPGVHWLPAMLVGGSGVPADGAGAAGRAWVWFDLWLAGAAACAGLTLIRTAAMSRLARCEGMPFPATWRRRLDDLARRAGIDPHRIDARVLPDGSAPGVMGVLRPRIHVPRELLRALRADEVDAVLLHELVHAARADNLRRTIQTGIVCVCWFHPLVWWFHRRLVMESERACDEAVVRLTGDREAYARGLIKAARHALELGLFGFSGMARHGLRLRVHAILHQPPRKDRLMHRLILVPLTLAGFLLTAGAAAPAARRHAKTYVVLNTVRDTAAETLDYAKLDQVPKLVTQKRPAYPRALKKAGISGRVVIEFIVDKEGRVRDASVVSASRPAFGESALAAVRQWRFVPGRHGGRAVNTRVRVPIVFTPSKK